MPLYCIDCKESKSETNQNPKIKQALFNFKDLKPLYCGTHKKKDMVNVKSKKCKKCDKQATYNYEGLSPEYCLTHKEKTMVDTRSKQCNGPNCNKQPKFEGGYCKPCFIIANPGMIPVNILYKTCEENGCPKVPHYNEPGKSVGLYCAKHAKKNLKTYENVVNKTCREAGCKKIPVFNTPGETVGLYCKPHAEIHLFEFENVMQKKCAHGRLSECAICKGGYRCKPHNKRKSDCKECGGCNICKICRERLRNPHSRYAYELPDEPGRFTTSCAQCYWNNLSEAVKDMSPDQICKLVQTVRYIKMKEVCITQHITKLYIKGAWRYQTYVPLYDNGDDQPRSKWYFLDMDCIVTANGLKLVLEVDEFQHRTTLCDLNRVSDITRAYGYHTVVIRFNPDSYVNEYGKNVQGMFTRTNEKNETVFEERMEKLVKILEIYSKFDTHEKPLLHIVYVNYSTNSEAVQEACARFGEEQVSVYQF